MTELDELIDTLGRLREARRLSAELTREKERRLRLVHTALGLPKTGPRGVAAVVRAELERRGWSRADIEEVGVSNMTVRMALDR